MRYTAPYLVFCAAVIALLVFLNSEQTFVLTQIIKVDLSLVGFLSGNLALTDEIVSLIASPFWGALSDKIGTRHVSVAGLLLLAAGIYAYPRMPVFWLLVPARAVFALGASAATSMITAALSELSMLSIEPGLHETDSVSETSFSEEGDQAPLFDEPLEAVAALPRPNGKLAGNVGLCSGLGAVFAVSVLLPLPTHLGDGRQGLISAFTLVCFGSLALAGVLYCLLYQNPTRSWRSFVFGRANISVFDEAAVDVEGTEMSYMELMKQGWVSAKNDRRVALGYAGSLCARATSVVLALFLPLWVNNWHYEHGLCDQNSTEGCKQAITQSAILTGVANTVMLVAAPLVGRASDWYGTSFVMGTTAAVGVVGIAGLCVLKTVYGFFPLLFSSLLGLSQIGTLTTSLSLCTDQRRVASGAVSGWYSFAGSAGIIIVTVLGGSSSYFWNRFPFLCLGVLLVALSAFSLRHLRLAKSLVPVVL